MLGNIQPEDFTVSYAPGTDISMIPLPSISGSGVVNTSNFPVLAAGVYNQNIIPDLPISVQVESFIKENGKMIIVATGLITLLVILKTRRG